MPIPYPVIATPYRLFSLPRLVGNVTTPAREPHRSYRRSTRPFCTVIALRARPTLSHGRTHRGANEPVMM